MSAFPHWDNPGLTSQAFGWRGGGERYVPGVGLAALLLKASHIISLHAPYSYAPLLLVSSMLSVHLEIPSTGSIHRRLHALCPYSTYRMVDTMRVYCEDGTDPGLVLARLPTLSDGCSD